MTVEEIKAYLQEQKSYILDLLSQPNDDHHVIKLKGKLEFINRITYWIEEKENETNRNI